MSAVEIHEQSLAEKLANELTFQEEQFALAYMANGGKVGAAAAEAGYAFPKVDGSRALARPRVVAYIEALRAERRAEINLALREKHWDKDRLLYELAAMAEFDLGDVLDDRGIIDRSKLKAKAKQLQSVEVDGGKTKIKGPDRLAALRMLAEHLGVTKGQQTNVQVNVDFGDLMAARMKRALEDR